MEISVLLVAPEPAASTVAQALHCELDAEVEVASDSRAALTALRRESFSLILLEENLGAADPEMTQMLYSGAGATPILEINFGLCGVDRVLRQVRSALTRRAQDEAKARRAASLSLHNELNASLTGLLLESQLALRQAGPDLLPTLRHVIDLASGMREQLRA